MLVSYSNAQFRDTYDNKPTIKESVISGDSDLLLGFINPSNFSMQHSYGMSYSSFGNQGVALGMYTNSLFYKFSDKLNIRVDASLVHSPYSSFGEDHQNQLGGIYLNRAEINYRPSEDSRISVGFYSNPYGYNRPYGYGGISPFSRYDRDYPIFPN